jgi:hypothetical protein
MRVLRRCAALLAALQLAGVLGGMTPAQADGGTGAVEVNYQDPVTALPPVSRPATRHCTVTEMRQDFANTISSPPYTGTVTPPAACPGPWAKVVLDWSGSVQGRQYDRLAGVWIGGAEVLRTSTPEPDPAGISWHVEKDVTAFAPLLRTQQPLAVSLANVVNSTYTGVYHMTLTLTYYQADRAHPAAATADQVLPLSSAASPAGWYTLGPGQSAAKTVTLPRNLTSVRLEAYARGGGCDEQWFTGVPNDLAAKYPDYLCGGGPYRELQVAVDGRPAGAVQPYPVVYSGGIVPTLWRPVPAIDQFRTEPYELDLTPFAGLLTDGRPHTITLTPYGDADNWTVDGTLFLGTDHRAARTYGALTTDTATASPDVRTVETSEPGGAVGVKVTAERDWSTSGWLRTSRGLIRTTVTQRAAYANTDTVSAGGQRQVVDQQERGVTTVTSSPGGTLTRAWSYPITVDSDVASYTDNNNFDLRASVTQGRQVVVHGPGVLSVTDDRVTASGVLARSGGATTAADGTDAERYVGTTDTGGCYGREIEAAHGYVTEDRHLPCVP